MLDHNARVALTVAPNQIKQLGCVSWVQTDTTMRGRSAQAPNVVRAVNGIATTEENRVRHGRIVVLAGIVHPSQHCRPITAGWCPVAATTG